MAGIKKATHTVVHPKLYLAVKGKQQHIKPGTGVTLTELQAQKLRKKVVRIGEQKSVDATPEDDKSSDV